MTSSNRARILSRHLPPALVLVATTLASLGEARGSIPAGETPDLGNIRARIVQYVEDEDDLPLAGAFVSASCEVGSIIGENLLELPLGTATSDENGEVSFSLEPLSTLPDIDLANCVINLNTHFPGFDTRTGGLFRTDRGEHEEEYDCQVELIPGASRLCRVLDASGEPLMGVLIDYETWDEELGCWGAIDCDYERSDANGYVLLSCDPDQRMRFTATHASAGVASLTVPTGTSQFELRLEARLEAISGRVLTGDGTPLSGRFVSITRWSEVRGEERCEYVKQQVDAQGRFALHPPSEGEWQLELEFEASREIYPDPLSVFPGTEGIELRDTGTFLMVNTVDREGRALNSMDPRGLRFDAATSGKLLLGHAAHERVYYSYGNFSERVSNGQWLLELPGAGEYELRAESFDGDVFAFGRERVHVRGGELQHVTLMIETLPRSQPIELDFRAADGHRIPVWSAMLIDSVSGSLHEEFSQRGVCHPHCLGPATYSKPAFRVGDYELQVIAPRLSFHLPASTKLRLDAGRPNQLTLRSPGLGGRVQLYFRESDEAPHGRKELRLELRRANESSTTLPHKLWLGAKVPDDGPPALLLEPGAWSWQLLNRADDVLQRGECEVRARLETKLEFVVKP